MADLPLTFIAVLGCAVNKDGTPTKQLESRLRKSLQVYTNIVSGRPQPEDVWVIVSGAGVLNNYVEGQVMRAWLISERQTPTQPSWESDVLSLDEESVSILAEKAGVAVSDKEGVANMFRSSEKLAPSLCYPPDDHIIAETNATDTVENCMYTIEIINKIIETELAKTSRPPLTSCQLFLVTSEFHIARASLICKRCIASLLTKRLPLSLFMPIGAEGHRTSQEARAQRRIREKMLIVTDSAKMDQALAKPHL